jgi:predicted acylesterase/phospholipase RssA
VSRSLYFPRHRASSPDANSISVVVGCRGGALVGSVTAVKKSPVRRHRANGDTTATSAFQNANDGSAGGSRSDDQNDQFLVAGLVAAGSDRRRLVP